MQAVITLCYFCENHGPRIVMTCQPMRNHSISRENDEADCDDDFPQFYGDVDEQDEITDDDERCAACSSFGAGLGILSNDHEAETSYVSTQMPINSRLHSMLKQACLRSLSVEISTPLFVDTACSDSASTSLSHLHTDASKKLSSGELQRGYSIHSEKDGVVLFGDDENGYTLSHTFRLKDAKARGFNRSYSLIVISRDKLMLLSNYEFFLGGFSAIISKIQSMAKAFFVKEQETDRDLRIAANVSTAKPWLPQQFYKHTLTLDTSRCLSVVTDNTDIFTILHRQMLYLLRTQTTLDRDTVLEGVPTQDMLVIMEMERSNLEENDLVTSLDSQQTLFHLYNLRHIVERFNEMDHHLMTMLIWQVVIGGQVSFIFSTLIDQYLLALGNLLPVGCIRIASNALKYIHSYKYNFLGCSVSTSIPEDVLSDIFIIRLTPKEGKDTCSDNLADFDFAVETYPSKDGPKPAILTRLLTLLLDQGIDLNTLESALRATRTDWLNNAKLIFQLRHQKEGIDIGKIIRVIKCNIQDSPVLLFWQSGLSRRYKQVVLNTIASSHSSNGT
ncbi:vesicle coat protein involved in golgi to plasma membrane transport domain-containing protein [Ditylenchus destructor]|uniref:Folliculin n=1 Tax=Ditylenchus destructor TaxID=166010 RepID=A0AAD4N9A1_9BILA|nr:vesicle coat protein involved in golgi to plasma membrane transport domain-containing protein [Ditylenchus destructor]